MSLTIPKDVVFKRVGDETVLLDFERGIYYGLNDTGTRVWELLEEGKGNEEIVAILTDEYDVERTALTHDVETLLAELLSHGLLATA